MVSLHTPFRAPADLFSLVWVKPPPPLLIHVPGRDGRVWVSTGAPEGNFRREIFRCGPRLLARPVISNRRSLRDPAQLWLADENKRRVPISVVLGRHGDTGEDPIPSRIP